MMRRALLVLLALAVVLPESGWAGGRGFHHRHRTFFAGAFFVGPPVWYAYHPAPYYYGPAFEGSNVAPSVYVEKFEGTPGADSGEIFCPQLGEYYPEVQECPGGWQRVVRAS
jgi:hypothetical protein